ncbi:hypothetical protein [Streptomyces sp. NPDC002564]|uniref:hypothetical protein n=1 Tax=Streptomyces sp. NPDC002564 TaxID=3364649 RepID=UPI0036BEA855
MGGVGRLAGVRGAEVFAGPESGRAGAGEAGEDCPPGSGEALRWTGRSAGAPGPAGRGACVAGPEVGAPRPGLFLEASVRVLRTASPWAGADGLPVAADRWTSVSGTGVGAPPTSGLLAEAVGGADGADASVRGAGPGDGEVPGAARTPGAPDVEELEAPDAPDAASPDLAAPDAGVPGPDLPLPEAESAPEAARWTDRPGDAARA